MKTPLILFSFFMVSFLISSAGNGQTKNIYGKVIDKHTQKPLYGVNICLKDNPQGIGTITNKNGEFRLWNLPSDTSTILISYDGYKNYVTDVGEFNKSQQDLTVVYLEKKSDHVNKTNILKLPLLSKKEKDH